MSSQQVGVGFDVGGTKILAGAVTGDGRVLAEARVATPAAPEQLLPSFSAALEELLDQLDGVEVAGIGIALPGLVDRAGVLHAAPNLGASDRGLDMVEAFGTPLRETIRRRGAAGHLPLALENDANCAAYGEYACGAARGTSHTVVVSLGTGVGGGVVTDGKLLRGSRSFAGEIGHMVVERDGIACPCGRRGCWEQYASGLGLARIARSLLGTGRRSSLLELAGSIDAVHGEHVAVAARSGDEVAIEAFGEFAEWLALGFANLVEILDPESIVIGGGLVSSADCFLEPTRAAYLRACRATQEPSPDDVVIAELGDHAACIGSGLLGLNGTL